jgi:hypothetical protein
MMIVDTTEMVPSVVQATNDLATAPTTAARSPWLRYGAVPGAVAVALLGRLLLGPAVGLELSYLFFWPAVVFAAWYGGLGPGLLATALSRDAIMTLAPPTWRFISGNPATVRMFAAKDEEEF